MGSGTPKIVYSPRYNISFFGFEKFHPFDSQKYGRAFALLREQLGRQLFARLLKPSRPVTRKQLLLVHTTAYLDRSLHSPKYLAGALEIPQLSRAPCWLTNWRVLRRMRYATEGTVLAARAAIRDGGIVFNLSGGYHHASKDRGHGFSIYSDVGIAVASLRATADLEPDDRVLYVDLDAHQGNGVARVFSDDPRVFIFDMYNDSIFPHDLEAKRRIDCDLPIPAGYDDSRYLKTLEAELPRFVESLMRTRPPRLAFYNAGTDIFKDDPLGQLRVTADGVLERDRFVLSLLRSHDIPAVVLPSGGYTRESYRLIANTILDAFA